MIKKIALKTKNGDEVMNLDTYARWLCLIEALEIISDKSKRFKMDMDKNFDWIKPIPLQKYIRDRFPSMLHDFRMEENLDVFDVSSGIPEFMENQIV